MGGGAPGQASSGCQLLPVCCRSLLSLGCWVRVVVRITHLVRSSPLFVCQGWVAFAVARPMCFTPLPAKCLASLPCDSPCCSVVAGASVAAAALAAVLMLRK